MATLFRLPLLGQTMQEGTILRWLKQEGESVAGWEPIVEVMTDKVNMEVEPQVSGTLRKILVPEGAVVPVGAPVCILGEPDEDISALVAEAARELGAVAAASPSPPASSAAVPTGAPGENGESGRPTAEPPAVSPRARELAREHGIDWRTLAIRGTGYEGMIVERDVRAYLEQRERVRLTPLAAKIAAEQGLSPESLPPPPPGQRIRAADVRRALPTPAPRQVRLAGIRKVIADRLSESYRQAPHVPLRVTATMDAAIALRDQLLPEWERAGWGRLTFTDLIVAAAVRALVEFPALNGTLEGDTLHLPGAVHVGVAVALDEGLAVPVVRHAERMPLPELSQALHALAEGARAGRLPPDAYAGGTFTVTNLGPFGIESFDPILNPPQIAILGCGAIRPDLVPGEHGPVVRRRMTLTLTFDHRAVDGAPAARCLARIQELLENPARLLL